MSTLDDFVPQKDFLICVDSDGCAMDTMDIKHKKCFGPCMVAEWGLEPWREQILTRWNEINLYTMTRGINRFKGLAMALKEIDKKFTPIPGVDVLCSWADSAKELSNRAVAEQAKITGETIFCKALTWSQAVNTSIEQLTQDEKQPFEGVLAGLAKAHKTADVAIVSSANADAVKAEWTACGLMPHIDLLLCQDAGSKAFCIGELKKKGYAANHILMVGDAPGDYTAALGNCVYFYPILVKRESESWHELVDHALERFTSEKYNEYQEWAVKRFLDNLNA